MKSSKTFRLLALAAALILPLLAQGDLSAAGLTTKIKVSFEGTNLERTTGLGKSVLAITSIFTGDLTDGVAINQADKIYTLKAQTIASAATLTLDLKGSLIDPSGAAFTPNKLKCLFIYSRSTNTTTLTLFNDAAHVPILSDVTVTTTLKPGGIFLLTDPSLAGIPVTAGTGDLILITNGSGAEAKVDIVLVGASS